MGTTQISDQPKRKIRRVFRFLFHFCVYSLALCSLFFIGTAVASKLNLTNNGGSVDVNNRYFENAAKKFNQGFQLDSAQIATEEVRLLKSLTILGSFYPQNAKLIFEKYSETNDLKIAFQMLEAVNIKLIKNKSYIRQIEALKRPKKASNFSVFEWSNFKEWREFRTAVLKDKEAIDSVSKITGVESRMIVMCLVGEQVRMFNASREKFKNYVLPFNHLIMPNNKSFGVTGMKESTAKRIERYMKDRTSEYYMGSYFETLLDTNSSVSILNDSIGNPYSIQISRLMQGKKHFYSYLYTALCIRELHTQWKNKGFPIDKRPEILATLYNLGFQKSKPKAKPEVGGAEFVVGKQNYTFGGLCFEFYFSGELEKEFPIQSKSFLEM